MLSLLSSLLVKTYIELFFNYLWKKVKKKRKWKKKQTDEFKGRSPGHTAWLLFTQELRRALWDISPAALELKPPTEEQHRKKEKLNVKMEPGGIKGPQRSKAKIIKKQDNGVSVENELCKLRVCACVRVHQFCCVIYFSLSSWQPTPEELINMTKKIHHALSVCHFLRVCASTHASVYVCACVSLRGTRSWCLCWLINTILLSMCLMWSLMFSLYTRLYHSKNQPGLMVRRRAWKRARLGVVLVRGQCVIILIKRGYEAKPHLI